MVALYVKMVGLMAAALAATQAHGQVWWTTTSFYCMNQPDTGTLYSHSCETDAVFLNAKFGKEYDFYCTNYGKGTYNQPGPILRSRGMCADSGPMKLPYWVSGLISMTCRGHNNDPWFGDGRSATLDDCATAVSTFNNLHFVYAAAANSSQTSALSPAPTQAMIAGMNSSSEFLSKRGNASMLNTTESLPAMLSASMAAMASVSPTSSPQSFYTFRVRNGFFTSNSAKAQAAVREAASAVGISVSWMDDTDTSVSGMTGLFLKVMMNAAVDHDAFILAFQTACRCEGLSYGISKWLSDVIEVASFYKFRVKNSFNPFVSNSAKAQAAMRTAASVMGAGVSWMNDAESGPTGFYLKVMLTEAVLYEAYIHACRRALQVQGLNWGDAADINLNYQCIAVGQACPQDWDCINNPMSSNCPDYCCGASRCTTDRLGQNPGVCKYR